MIKVTTTAQKYLKDLLSKQDKPGMSVRVFITDPGTSKAETCLSYCRPNQELASDKLLEFNDLRFFIDAASVAYLQDASIDFVENDSGGEIVIKAPNAKMENITTESPINVQINYILDNDINPGLAEHGGFARLVEYDEQTHIAVLAFGGGCQGCSQIDATVKGYVEKTLMDKIPQLKGITDVTDHTDLSHAYY
jgi:Fe/S biogenesis protein NfuA